MTDRPSLTTLLGYDAQGKFDPHNVQARFIRPKNAAIDPNSIDVIDQGGNIHSFTLDQGHGTLNSFYKEVMPHLTQIAGSMYVFNGQKYTAETDDIVRQPAETILSWDVIKFDGKGGFSEHTQNVVIKDITPRALVTAAPGIIRLHPNSDGVCRDDVRHNYIGPRFDKSNCG
jgi:hypothetical protein